MIQLDIQVMGQFAVRVNGSPIERGTWRRRWIQLCAVLALSDGYAISRGAALRALGLEDDPGGRGALATSLSNLRTVLVDACHQGGAPSPDRRSIVQSSDGLIRLNPRLCDICVDALRWETACRGLLKHSSHLPDPGVVAALLAAYDRLAPELTDVEPCRDQQRYLDRLFAGVVARSLPTVPDSLAARRLWRQHRQLLREQLPGAEYRRLDTALGSRAIPERPASSSSRQRAAPLEGAGPTHAVRDLPRRQPPGAEAPFVGREGELCELAMALENRRLVILTGVGGMGKTRLAIECARRNAVRFPGAVHLVQLAGVARAADLSFSIAFALGITGAAADQSWLAAIVTRLRGKRALLLLDNCEHVAEPLGRLVAGLLVQVPDLTILATTQRLFLREEAYVLRLAPLRYPRQLPDGDGWRAYDALQLASERVAARQASQPGPQLRVADLEALLSICRSLDGVPLFIEQILSLADTMTLPQIAHELRAQGIAALPPRTDGSPARHRSPEAVFDYTLGHVPERARTVLLRMWPFARGFTLDAVRFMCPEIPAAELAPILRDLLAHRLLAPARRDDPLRADAQAGDPADAPLDARYVMAVPLRQHCERLADTSGQREQHEHGLTEWIRRSIAPLEANFVGGEAEQMRAFAAARDELPNIRNALHWVEQHPTHRSVGVAIVAALVQFWRTQGHNAEGAEWCWRFLPGTRDDPDDADAPPADADATVEDAKVLLGAGMLAHISGIRAKRSLGWLRRAERIFARVRAWRDLGYTRCRIAVVLEHAGEYEEAVSYYLDALALGEEHGDDFLMATAGYALGTCCTRRGLSANARDAFHRARLHAERAGSARLLVMIAHELAKVEADPAHPEEAIRTLLACVDAYRRYGDRPSVTATLMHIAQLTLMQGDVPSALAYAEQDLRDADLKAAPHTICYWQHIRGVCAFFLGRMNEAERSLHESCVLARELHFAEGEVRALTRLAQLALTRDAIDEADRLLDPARSFFAANPEHHYVASYHVVRALLHTARGDLMDATRELGRLDAVERTLAPTWFAPDRAARDDLAERIRAALGAEQFAATYESACVQWHRRRVPISGPAAARPPVTPAAPVAPARAVALTKREEQLVELVAHGLSYGEIAAQLGTSPHTVRHQITALRAKLGNLSREALVRWCADRVVAVG